jgi:Flp pilus assembly protein TadD
MTPLKCVHCGQQVREDWLRCPSCRELLEAVPVEAANVAEPVAEDAGPATGWLVVGGAVALCVIGVGLAIQSNLPPATVAATASTGRPIVQPAGTESTGEEIAAPDTSADARQHQALDARRSGAAAYARGDLAGSVSRYEEAVAASPEDAGARNDLGQVLVRLERSREAIPHFDEAIRLDPEEWAYRFNRARAYGQLQQWNDAVRDYRAAVRLFPDDYATHYNLGLALMRLKQYPEAAATLEQAVTMAPGESTFLITLGTAYVGAQRPDRARATFERFLTLFPDDGEAETIKELLQAMTEAGQ